jgi:dsDNA-specific endonuclease/ATPase MutS2
MTISMSCSLRQAIEFTQSLSQTLGETWGDIPVYSLHKIKNLLKKIGIKISPDMQKLLIETLIRANQIYREQSGNNYNCLTSNNLVWAIEQIDQSLKDLIQQINANVGQENALAAQMLTKSLEDKRSRAMEIIKNWFHDNYERLLYDMSSHIPWPIIQKLRYSLLIWKMGAINPFVQDIEEVILEVAEAQGIQTDNAEIAWQAMGGRLFTKKS